MTVELTKLLLPWHREQWDLFTSYQKQHRIPQALLIMGNKGLGKEVLARQFAQSLVCNGQSDNGFYCGQCHGCRLFAANTHPDFFSLQPEEPGKDITIGQIRELIAKLALKPQYEAYRVAVINPADKMNNAAANGFLKCLEEPTERTILILVTDRPAVLPVTIRSRCQILKIHNPNQREAIQWLNDQKTPGDLEMLLSLSQGSPCLAKNYADREILELRRNCFTAWMQLAQKKTDPVSVAEEWIKYPVIELLLWITSWVIDLIKYRNQVKSGVFYNPDFQQPLQVLAQKLELNQLFNFYDLLLQSRQRLDTQLNKQLLIEELLIHWSQINSKK